MKLFKPAAAWALCLLLPYLAAYGLCWLVLLTDDFELVWLLIAVGLLTPVLYAFSGYFAPPVLRDTPPRRLVPILAVLTLLPAALIVWGESSGNALMWTLDLPHRMTYLAWFSPLLSNTTGAFFHNVIEPLCTGLTHVLTMAGFAFGMFVRKQKSS